MNKINKKTSNLLILLNILTCSFTTQAHIFSFISYTEYKPSHGSYDYGYHYTISSWTTESDSLSNPCYGEKSCYLYISHRHNSNGTSGHMDDIYEPVNIGDAKTIGDVRKIWISAHPLPLSDVTYHDGKVNTEECVGLFYGSISEKGYDNPLFPSSVCGIAPPPTGHCQFNGNATIDYGNISSDTLNGKEISTSISVSCDEDINLQAWLINPKDGTDIVPLRDDGSLKAKLTLDGQNASEEGKIFSVSSGQSVPLTITSQAIVNGTPQAGEFSGSAIAELSIP